MKFQDISTCITILSNTNLSKDVEDSLESGINKRYFQLQKECLTYRPTMYHHLKFQDILTFL